MVYDSKFLEETSPTYNAYLQLDRVPANAPHFEVDELDYPVVEYGEIFCRMPHHIQNHCSSKFSARSKLLRHLEKVHGAERADRHPMPFSQQVLARAQQHYITLMKDYDYNGKGSEKKVQRKSAGPRSKHLRASQTSTLLRVDQPALESETSPFMLPRQSENFTNRPKSIRVTRQSSMLIKRENGAARESVESTSLSDDDPEEVDVKPGVALLEQRDQSSEQITAPSTMSIDSDDDLEPETIKVESRAHASRRTSNVEESSDDDLKLEIEADEIRLRIVENKQKLAARKKKKRQEHR